MASVLFSTIGQAVGGPLGAGLGAAVGATVDASLFGRNRPGASDLYVQRSAYGAILPKLFGTTRVAGQLIWAMPMEQGGQSKGSGRQSSATSFAIAICAGPIVAVRRIWADGREIRNSDGEFELETEMRVHGAGGISPDPLVVAAEGNGFAPAYQGLSYVLFENFELGPFGNRIPNLSFEVIADENGAAQWLGDFSEVARTVADPAGEREGATGFVATANRFSDDLNILVSVANITPSLADGQLTLGKAPRTYAVSSAEFLASLQPNDREPNRQTAQKPGSLGLEYLDPARDYQFGRQSVSRGRLGRELTASWPLCATAEVAQAVANRLLRKAELGAERLSLGLPWRWLELTVGDQLQLDDGSMWRVVSREIRALTIQVEAERVGGALRVGQVAADSGRGLSAAFAPASPTVLVSLESPVAVQGGGAKLLAVGVGAAEWRGAEISALAAGGEVGIGFAGRGTPFGRLLEPLLPGSEVIWDEQGTLLLSVEPYAPVFESRSEMEVLSGANLIRVGDELLQFRSAEILDGTSVRLAGLLRGRFGTGFRASGSPVGTLVVLVKAGSLPELPIDADLVGREIILLASSAGDPPGGTEFVHQVEGLGLAVLAPVHLRTARYEDSSVRSTWIARQRETWSWSGGPDPFSPRFIWHHVGDDFIVRSVPVEGVSLTLSVAEQQSRFGMALPSGTVSVESVGDGPMDLRLSRPCRL